ncbi:MAG: low molecular weight protein-tyrosine-phosphatase [Bacteroidota bacterium]|jgi:protein-tyrosine phosphatase
MKVLMVCLGNICRSPLAEGILRHKCEKLGLDWQVDSAGTHGYHNGEPPHYLSQNVAKLNGIDIAGQRSRPFRSTDYQHFDLIVPMANDVLQDIQQISRQHFSSDKTKMMLDFLFPETGMDVPDPWSKSEAAYHEVFDLIDKACDKLIEEYTSIKQP